MALSSVTYTATGSTQTFAVTFPFISRSHVTVKVNGIATTNFTWDNDSQIQITTPTVVNNDTVKIERSTSPSVSLVDWQDGDNLTESDLNTERLQSFYLIQEIKDQADDTEAGAVDPFDAVTDTDGDTKIQTEESSDEDIIRVDIGGTQKGYWDSTGLGLGNEAPSEVLDVTGSIKSSSEVIAKGIVDADKDTKIQVEESTDEDVIRFDVGGTQVGDWDSSSFDLTTNITASNLGTASAKDTGTSGDVVPLLNAANTFSVDNSTPLIVNSETVSAETRMRLRNTGTGSGISLSLGLSGTDTQASLRLTSGGFQFYVGQTDGANPTSGTSAGRIYSDGSLVIGAPTGNNQGAGTLNAEGLFVNGGALTGAWTNSGAIDLTSGSPTSVSLLSGASSVSEIEIYITEVSTDTNNQAPMLQIGDSGGLESSGYNGIAGYNDASVDAGTANSSGFLLAEENRFDAANSGNFLVYLKHMGSNFWVLQSAVGNKNTVSTMVLSALGDKTLSAVLDRVTITTSGGLAVFDGGTAYVRHR